jgi:hypothetical protein
MSRSITQREYNYGCGNRKMHQRRIARMSKTLKHREKQEIMLNIKDDLIKQ